MTAAKPYPSKMSAGQALTLNKINTIIDKVSDRRIIAHVTGLLSSAGDLYGVNDGTNVIRIEARTVVTTTEAPGEYGGAKVAFSSENAFKEIPVVVCSWGDISALKTDDAGEGRVNPPILTPRNITRAGFTVFGARETGQRVRINYIAIGPAS